jgi:hypothetical protein
MVLKDVPATKVKLIKTFHLPLEFFAETVLIVFY